MSERMKQYELKNYLKLVYKLESDCFALNQSIQGLKREKKRLGVRRKIEKEYARPDYSSFTIAGITVAVVFFPILLVISILASCGRGDYLSPSLSGMLHTLGVDFVIAVIPGLVIAIIPNICIALSSRGKNKKLNQKYLKKIEIDKDRVSKEMIMARKTDISINVLQQNLFKEENMLRKLYNYNIIYSKYRNLNAIASFCEYFESKRVSELTGHEGAYNLYENEIRLGMIITNTEIIISKLDEIKFNQNMMYNAIQESKRLSSAVLNSQLVSNRQNEKLIANQEVIKIQNDCIRREAEFNNFLNIYKL